MATDVSDILDRIQREIPIEDITPDRVAMFLAGHDPRGKTIGRRKLGTIISNTIQTELKISRTITLTNDFAREKGITLSEKTKGGIYQKWGRYLKPAVVIFSKGKIKTWKYIT